MAEINWDFAVERHLQTMMRIGFEEGPEAVDVRCDDLGIGGAFKQRLLAAVRGEDVSGTPY